MSVSVFAGMPRAKRDADVQCVYSLSVLACVKAASSVPPYIRHRMREASAMKGTQHVQQGERRGQQSVLLVRHVVHV